MKYCSKSLAFASLATALVAAGGFMIDNSTRPAADIARDAARKPAEMVAFAKIMPGQTVVDMLPGGGYFTRVFSQAVGKTGKVIAYIPEANAARFPKGVEGMKALATEPAYSNIQLVVGGLADLGPASSADRIWTSQNYHDLHSGKLPAGTIDAVNRAVFVALKPGGLYIVVDHNAAKGSGAGSVDTLHRIDGALVKSEVTAAGFKFAGESKALLNKDDDGTKGVRDVELRGHTNQFAYRFVKPKT